MELTQELLEKILDKYVECRYCKAKNIECSCFVLDETKIHDIMQEIEKERKNGKERRYLTIRQKHYCE